MTGSTLHSIVIDIIEDFIIENNPTALDDMIPDLFSDTDQRQQAIDDFIEWLENNREVS